MLEQEVLLTDVTVHEVAQPELSHLDVDQSEISEVDITEQPPELQQMVPHCEEEPFVQILDTAILEAPMVTVLPEKAHHANSNFICREKKEKVKKEAPKREHKVETETRRVPRLRVISSKRLPPQPASQTVAQSGAQSQHLGCLKLTIRRLHPHARGDTSPVSTARRRTVYEVLSPPLLSPESPRKKKKKKKDKKKASEHRKHARRREDKRSPVAVGAKRIRLIATVAAFAASEGHAHPRVVELPKTDEGLGFNVMGGKEQNSPIYISRIIPGGVADRHGALKRGDQLLSVNGVSVEGENHEKAVELLKAAQGTVKLVVRYTPKVLEEMEMRFDKQRATRRRVNAS
ncbi:hypothetical protein HPB51_015279 [Rhipicephalus microplus]|uniref:PDZ domain-containing protein n=1 Tax=Rhipicephalus microplus TaxID=6941 RepID=A0A9J6DVG4_RHIMP|nr:hypothetical protein HPB51_015279 [Rhipicephalus microplus]